MGKTGKIQAGSFMLMAVVATVAMAEEGGRAVTEHRQVMFRDSVTGEMRAPTPGELAKMPAAVPRQRSAQPMPGADARPAMRKVRLSTGAEVMVMDVPPSLENSLVIERGAEGEYRMRHAGQAAATQEAEQ